ncbi:MAG: OsmC family peroxiredoxin [Gammaproteobacteria bacterium]|nr:OsmC family peroxiredoxin [Gammaproteobacteria bacterium]
MSEEGRFTIHLEHLEDYEFKVKFDWGSADDVLMDEPAPLGRRAGPNASRMLAAAAANCLSASLMFCVSKSEVPPQSMKTSAICKLVRNEKGRLRVGGMEVKLSVAAGIEQSARLKRCLTLFEDFCVVSASIRQGIPLAVTVENEAGEVLHQSD